MIILISLYPRWRAKRRKTEAEARARYRERHTGPVYFFMPFRFDGPTYKNGLYLHYSGGGGGGGYYATGTGTLTSGGKP